MHLPAREAGGIGAHRPIVELRHQRQQGRAVDAARQEHAIGHVGALVHLDAAGKRVLQARYRLRLRPAGDAVVGQGRAA